MGRLRFIFGAKVSLKKAHHLKGLCYNEVGENDDKHHSLFW